MTDRNFIKDALLGVATGDALGVHLGNDTDTTAAVTGGLAGLTYGWETIPADWLNVLAKRDAIDQLITNLQAKIYG
ncbi:ADP-ribosylglycohydrolase family protein [Chitinophaga sp. S165]|uniref:ADP-ribosylglycohydrolase family protein n=1 Tax=Chitinophaga sp. S165 TaxID=2135462 RepID=UPI000D8D975A|nr:ADP-ribosylglycohydrolase family protein [Chitinophaga sp. S165]PWV54517.1 ADP-ribosylglycohydrolase [Chitinophaga sp. S165]